MSTTNADISLILNRILEERRLRNQSYSLRAFARDLNISSGRLSDILNKKYIPGTSIANRIVESLNLCEEERRRVALIIEDSHRIKKELGGAKPLSEDELSVIYDWHHFAIVNLMQTSNYEEDFSWVAERLHLDIEVVKESYAKLLSLGLIELKGDRHVTTNKNLTTTHNIPSKVLREANRQVIIQSLDSLEEDDPEFRDITSITLPINVANLPAAKELARDFRRKIATLLEEGDKTEVYNVCVQIVPVTRNKKILEISEGF